MEGKPGDPADAILAHVADMMARGFEAQAIRSDLVDKGLGEQDAAEIVAGMIAARGRRRRRGGIKGIFVGGGACLLGLAITAGSYGAAGESGAGTYIVAYGLIAGGAITFLAGLLRALTGR
jgi:hypothetical protein